MTSVWPCHLRKTLAFVITGSFGTRLVQLTKAKGHEMTLLLRQHHVSAVNGRQCKNRAVRRELLSFCLVLCPLFLLKPFSIRHRSHSRHDSHEGRLILLVAACIQLFVRRWYGILT